VRPFGIELAEEGIEALLAGVAIAALCATFIPYSPGTAKIVDMLIGDPRSTMRFLGLFLCGATFYVCRDLLRYRNNSAIIAAILLVAAMFNHVTEEFAVPILGGYLVFWFAFLPATPRLNRINSSRDISYGLYLYAWPIQNLLLRYVADISPYAVMIVTTVLSGGLAFLSWRYVEKPSLSLKDRTVLVTA
jgi:peptidoglycan/LPS O-acetylase OafA/YrhL